MSNSRYTIRWTAMDGLAHWVGPWKHARLCDGRPIAGFNHVVGNVTCFRCTRFVRKRGTLLLDGKA